MPGRIELVEQRLSKGTIVSERYELDRIVGEGGMGVVWAATDVRSKEPRALKFLKSADERAQTRLLREARAASKVSHPNVARVLEVGSLPNGQPYLVMDLFRGETLGARLSRGVLDLGETSRIFLQVVSAIEAAHALGIVHRDLKPENIFLLEGTGDVRVLDFGIAKEIERATDETSISLTATGSMIGTPHYMAPEQIFGDSDIDVRADVWALGVILYESVTGKRPTEASGVGQVLKIITTDSIPPISSVAPTVPVVLSDLLARMLTRDRTKRPSLATVRTTLEMLEGGPLVASDPGVLASPTLDTKTPAPSSPSPTPTPTPTPTPAPAQKARVLPWIGAGAVALGVVGVVAFANRERPVDSPDATPAPIIAEPSIDASSSSSIDEPAVPEDATVVSAPVPLDAATRNPMVGTARDGGIPAKADAGVSTGDGGRRSVNILTHDRT